MNIRNTDIFGRKIFFIAPNSALIPSSFMEKLCTLGYESHIVTHGGGLSDSVKKITENFPDALIFFNIETSAPGMGWTQFIRQVQQDNSEIAVGIVFEATNQEHVSHVQAEYGSIVTTECLALSHANEKENFATLLSVLEKSGAKGRRNNIRAKCDETSHIFFRQGSVNFHVKLDDVNISHICCIVEGSESFHDIKIYDKIRDAHINVNGFEFTSDIVLIMKRVKTGVSTAVFMFIKKPDDEPGLETEIEGQLNKKIYEIMSKEFTQFFHK